jgi:hypothetical protein
MIPRGACPFRHYSQSLRSRRTKQVANKNVWCSHGYQYPEPDTTYQNIISECSALKYIRHTSTDIDRTLAHRCICPSISREFSSSGEIMISLNSFFIAQAGEKGRRPSRDPYKIYGNLRSLSWMCFSIVGSKQSI